MLRNDPAAIANIRSARLTVMPHRSRSSLHKSTLPAVELMMVYRVGFVIVTVSAVRSQVKPEQESAMARLDHPAICLQDIGPQ
ncbi:hypothetical protein DPEC_G00316880 [Dallia pectoralis]|uniref:Uncharacterized protein n=1 Tax=Dallia pectoralis TaxID=75939 RepID=A0ACC2FCT8_DALPE|nr:hypothetical protein DPEC_G00316880 [Dallia pectoralis]